MTTLQYYQSSDDNIDPLRHFFNTFKGDWANKDTYRLESADGETVTVHGDFNHGSSTEKVTPSEMDDIILRDAHGHKVAVISDIDWELYWIEDWRVNSINIQKAYFDTLAFTSKLVGTGDHDVIETGTPGLEADAQIGDTIFGKAGDDTVVVTHDESFSYRDMYFGGRGNDTLDLSRLYHPDGDTTDPDSGVFMMCNNVRNDHSNMAFANFSARVKGFENYVGTDYADYFMDSWGSETFDGRGGDDSFEHFYGGNDKYLFGVGSDHDEITGFVVGEEQVILRADLGIHSFSQLKHFMSSKMDGDSGFKSTFDFGNNDVLTVYTYNNEHLTARDFIFQ